MFNGDFSAMGQRAPTSDPEATPMKQSKHFLENAENCAQFAESAADEPTYKRYKRMEAAWRALAIEQDWLDGEMASNKQQDLARRLISQTPRKAPVVVGGVRIGLFFM